MVRLVETKIEFPYKRSLGPVIGAFSAALAEHRITGVRTSAGRVLCPPLEYDPDTGEANDPAPVEVGPAGTVTSWTWVPEPLPNHPLDRPFAFAMIKLDGADTEMFHAVDAGSEDAITRGTRVLPQWRDEPRGRIDDLAYFVPESAAPAEASGPVPAKDAEPREDDGALGFADLQRGGRARRRALRERAARGPHHRPEVPARAVAPISRRATAARSTASR